jgi:hypothetical protein
MRWLPKSIPFLVASIALYFTFYFGIEAVSILMSPIYGLDQAGLAYIVHGIGRHLGLGPSGLMQLAAILGAVKLAIAMLFAVYLVSRLKALLGYETNHEIVDAAVILIVMTTVVAATPALFDGATNLLAQYRLPLWLAGLVATLSMIERVAADEGDRSAEHTATQEVDIMLPPQRCGVSSLRWNYLRRSANVGAA